MVMKKLNTNFLIQMIIITISLCLFLNCFVYADENESITNDLNNWSSTYSPQFIGIPSDNSTINTHVVQLPTADLNNNITLNEDTGKYKYYGSDGKGYDLNLKLIINYSDGSTETVNSVTGFDKNGVPYALLNDKDSQAYEGSTVKIEYEIPELNYTLDGKTTSNPKIKKVEKGFFEKVLEAGGKAVDVLLTPIRFITDKLSQILTDLFLAMADGLRDLVAKAVGENNISLESIIFGKVEILKINYWQGVSKGSPAGTLQNTVVTWYNRFQAIGVSIYLVMLLYIGVRILLASTGKSKERYKSLLADWCTGIVILFLFPYVMKYTVTINETIVASIENSGNSIQGEIIGGADENVDVMDQLKGIAKSSHNLIVVFMYIIMIGQVIALIVVYYKRVFMLAFLITIFPTVATFYIFEKAQRNSTRTLSNWIKEYTTLVFIQVVHAVVYVVLIEGAFESFNFSENGNNNFVLYIICILFLFKAEKIVKSIFNIKSGAGMLEDLAVTGTAMLTMSSQAKDLFKREKGKDEEENERDEAEETTREYEKQQRHNMLVQKQKREIEESREQDNSSTSNSNIDIYIARSNDSKDADDSSSGSPKEPDNMPPASDNDNSQDTFTVPVGRPQAQLESNTTIDNQHDVDVKVEETKSEKTETNTRISAEEMAKATAVARKQALNKRSKANIIKKAMKSTGKIAGTSMGVVTGLAQGDVQAAVKNAVSYGAIGSSVGSAIGSGVAAAERKIAGEKLAYDIKRGKYDKDFQDVGVDPQLMSSKKAELFRNVIAAYSSGTTSGGTTKGELKKVKEEVKQTKKTIEEAKDN